MTRELEQGDLLPTIEELMRAPAASTWLRSALSAALLRDPVDAANDGELLAKLLDRRCRPLLNCDLTTS